MFRLQNDHWISNPSHEQVMEYWQKNKSKQIFWDEIGVHPIQKILDKRVSHGKVQYKVKFYARDIPISWLAAQDITPDAIAEFENHMQLHEFLSIDLTQAEKVYQDATISQKHSKREANELFAMCILKYAPKNGRIIYLEAPNMTTTKILKKFKIQNPCVAVNFDVHVVNQMLLQQMENVEPLYASLNQAIQLNEHLLAAVWSDYCCTFDGQDISCPQNDFIELFASGKLMDKSVLAMTFSLRDRRRKFERFDERRRRIVEFIETTARAHNYEVHILKRMNYGKNMHLALFLCTKPSPKKLCQSSTCPKMLQPKNFSKRKTLGKQPRNSKKMKRDGGPYKYADKQRAGESDAGACILHSLNACVSDVLTAKELDEQIEVVFNDLHSRNPSITREHCGIIGTTWHQNCIPLALSKKYGPDGFLWEQLPDDAIWRKGLGKLYIHGLLDSTYFKMSPDGDWRHTCAIDTDLGTISDINIPNSWEGLDCYKSKKRNRFFMKEIWQVFRIQILRPSPRDALVEEIFELEVDNS
jgi:hypothetical protein